MSVSVHTTSVHSHFGPLTHHGSPITFSAILQYRIGVGLAMNSLLTYCVEFKHRCGSDIIALSLIGTLYWWSLYDICIIICKNSNWSGRVTYDGPVDNSTVTVKPARYPELDRRGWKLSIGAVRAAYCEIVWCDLVIHMTNKRSCEDWVCLIRVRDWQTAEHCVTCARRHRTDRRKSVI